MARVEPTFELTRGGQEPMRAPLWARSVGLAAGVIVLATWMAYANSLWVPFLFDDQQTIMFNDSIRHLWPLGPVLSPPAGGGTSGRPLTNLTFAVNHAIGGDAVVGYHAFNLTVHVLAALTLFGIVRRALLSPLCRDRFGGLALPLAGVSALVWALHPLQTEAVTYLSQRTESLMGLCYLQTLYGFIRASKSATPRSWLAWSVVACLLGALTKEVIVTAPLLVLLCDRTFVAGSLREAWRQRKGYYAALAVTWVLLAWLMRGLAARHVGYGLGVSPWTCALTESWAVVHYLRLALWPHPLLFDYGAGMLPVSALTLGCILVVAGLVGATIWACWRRPALGFAGAAVFLCLAPASSVVPVVMQPVAEHRVYLALAGVVVLVVVGMHALFGRWVIAATAIIAVVLGFLTVQRNAVYFSEATLWGDVVSQRPDNARAQNNLGSALVREGRVGEASEHFARLVQLKPDDAEARYNLGNALLQLGRMGEAAAECAVALRLKPDFAEAHCLMGSALAQSGRIDEAVTHFQAAVKLDPSSFGTHFDLGQAWFELHRYPEAAEEFAEVVRLRPDFAEAHRRLANVLIQLKRGDEARAHLAEAQRLSAAVHPVAAPDR